jgi:hypothetical protein
MALLLVASYLGSQRRDERDEGHVYRGTIYEKIRTRRFLYESRRSICSAPKIRAVHHSIAYGDTANVFLTGSTAPARATLMRPDRHSDSKGASSQDNSGGHYSVFCRHRSCEALWYDRTWG